MVTGENDVEAFVSVAILSTINTITAVLLNNQSVGTSPLSFYDPINNMIYSIAQAKVNSANVHIVHALRTPVSGGRKLFAPNSVDAIDIYDKPLNPDRIGTWSTRNATKFKAITLSEQDFNNINDVGSLRAAAGASGTYSADNVVNLVTGSTFGVFVANGKFGVGRITSTTGPDAFVPGGANDGSLTITFKVEK